MGKKMDARQYIKIRGANENNLKNTTILFVMLSRSIIYHILKTVFKLRTFFA